MKIEDLKHRHRTLTKPKMAEGVAYAAVLAKLAVDGRIDGTQIDMSDNKYFVSSIKGLFDNQSDFSCMLADMLVSNSIEFNKELQDIYRDLLTCTSKELEEIIITFDKNRVKADPKYSEYSVLPELYPLLERVVNMNEVKTVCDLNSGWGFLLSELTVKHPHIRTVAYEQNDSKRWYTNLKMEALNPGNHTGKPNSIFSSEAEPVYDLCFGGFASGAEHAEYIAPDLRKDLDYSQMGKKADWAYVYKAIHSIHENGKAIVVMPRFSLTNPLKEKFRKQIMENGYLEKVIQMPAGTLPRTNMSYSVLVFSANNRSVEFVDCRDCWKEESGRKCIDWGMVENRYAKNHEILKNTEILERECALDISLYREEKRFAEELHATKIQELCDTFIGQDMLKDKEAEDPVDVRLIRVCDLEDGMVNYDNLVTATMERNRVKDFLLQENDVVLAAKGIAFQAAVVRNLTEDTVASNTILVLRVKNPEKLVPGYLCACLNSQFGKDRLQEIQGEGKLVFITRRALNQLEIPVVDVEVQKKIAMRQEECWERMANAKKVLKDTKEELELVFTSEIGEI